MRKDERNVNVENAGRGNSAMDKAMYCHIIEAISDKADDSEEMSYEQFEEEAAIHCAAVTKYMILHDSD